MNHRSSGRRALERSGVKGVVSRSVVLVFVLAAGALRGNAQTACHVVPVQDGAVPPNAGSNGAAIASKLDGIQSGIAVKTLDASTLLVCADAPTTAEVVKVIRLLSTKENPTPGPTDQHSIRLFFNRDASNIATALSGIFKDLSLQALGSDTLVFRSGDRDQEKNIYELRRWISIRPQRTSQKPFD